MLATTFGVGRVAFTLLWVFAFFVEIFLMVSIFIDLFRSDDLRGVAKAARVLLAIILPIIGILAYLIARGDSMVVHRRQATQAAQARVDDEDVRDLAGPSQSKADEIAGLAELRVRSDITAEEFEHLKAEVIGWQSAAGGDGPPAERRRTGAGADTAPAGYFSV